MSSSCQSPLTSDMMMQLLAAWLVAALCTDFRMGALFSALENSSSAKWRWPRS